MRRHFNGINIHSARKFTKFLFGAENYIRAHENDDGIFIYFHQKAFPNEAYLKIREKFEKKYDKIKIRIVGEEIEKDKKEKQTPQ